MGIGEHTLEAEVRDASIKPSQIRSAGKVPAIVYGNNIDPVSISLDARTFNKLFHHAGESTLIDLTIGTEQPRPILFKEPQYDAKTGAIIHIDLYQVNLTEKIRAEVPLEFIGESPALETNEAILVTNKDKVEVECLPRELPHAIQVDLSTLANVDDTIQVKDLKVPTGVEILNDPEESVVLVAQQREEEPEEAVSEADAIAAVEATSEKPAEENSEG